MCVFVGSCYPVQKQSVSKPEYTKNKSKTHNRKIGIGIIMINLRQQKICSSSSSSSSSSIFFLFFQKFQQNILLSFCDLIRLTVLVCVSSSIEFLLILGPNDKK